MSEEVVIRPPRDQQELARLHHLRWEMLRKPLGMPPGSELDESDLDTIHIGAWVGERAVGVGRLVPRGRGTYQVKSMATAPDWRRRGIGRRILAALVGLAKERGATSLFLQARTLAVPFYSGCGWQVTGEEFMIEGIGPHYRMVRDPHTIS